MTKQHEEAPRNDSLTGVTWQLGSLLGVYSLQIEFNTHDEKVIYYFFIYFKAKILRNRGLRWWLD